MGQYETDPKVFDGLLVGCVVKKRLMTPSVYESSVWIKPFAPNYANIFMTTIEQYSLSNILEKIYR